MSNSDTADEMAGSINTGELIWNFLWRATLYGVLFGAGFGALYGAAFGTLTFPIIGTVVGFFFGALTGVVVGVPLGLLNAVLLFGLTMSTHDARHLNPRRYRWTAGIVCATGSLLALMVDWELHNFPAPETFATNRAPRLPLGLFLPLDEPTTNVPPNALNLTVWVFVPLVMILFASWLTGRFVAGWYVRRTLEMQPEISGQRTL